MPKISVIVPVYKVEAYICRCIESIIHQTYTDLEIILVDDGSPDRCGQICDEYAAKDKRIRVIHKENGGVSSARNAGLDIATGEYVTFVDSDDFINSHMYEHLISIAIREHSDLVECGYQWGSYPNADSEKIYFYTNISSIKKAFRDSRFGSGLSISACGKLFGRAIFENIRFLENSSYGEDMEASIRAFYYSSKVVKLDSTLYMYTQNDGSRMNSAYAPDKALGEIYANKSLVHFFKQKREYELSRFFLSRTISIIFSHLYKCYGNRAYPEFNNAITTIRSDLIHLYKDEKNSFRLKERLIYNLFRISPHIWFFLVRLRRHIRKRKWVPDYV